MDEVAIVTSGVQRIIVNENGFVGISNRNPGDYNTGANNLVLGDVTQADNGLTIVSGNASAGIINFADGTGLAASEGQIFTIIRQPPGVPDRWSGVHENHWSE